MQPYIQAGIYTGLHTYIRNAYIHACIHTYTHDINPPMHTHNKTHIQIKACIEAYANMSVHNCMCTGGTYAYLKSMHAYIHVYTYRYIHTENIRATHTQSPHNRTSQSQTHIHPLMLLYCLKKHADL